MPAKFRNEPAITVRALFTSAAVADEKKRIYIYEGIRGLLVNNEVFIWNCVSWKSSPFLFRVSPEIYEHLERGFGRAGTRATKWTATRTTVRHISIPRREQQRLFPRSVLHYISTINRTTGTKLLSARTNGLESTGNDTWFMVLLHARARLH